jgi:adenylate cyclase class IV
MRGFHECELKVKIDDKFGAEIHELVIRKGYSLTDSRVETDYIMDIHDNSGGGNLFRVRKINNKNGETILYTVKIKGVSTDYQDYTEYEITPEEEGADIMVQLIKSVWGVDLDESFFKITDVNKALDRLICEGFIIKRVYQKKREEYSTNDSKVLFDIFPEPVGMFVEIEAGSEEGLKYTVVNLGLTNFPIESRNYGQIIKDALAGNNHLMFE